MQLQQSSFLIYRALLSRIPKCLIVVIMVMLCALLVTEMVFVLRRPSIPSFKECLEDYYNHTHVSVSDYVEQLMANNETLDHEKVKQNFAFINSSTLLDIIISPNASNYQIQFNTQTSTIHPSLHVATNSAILRFNFTQGNGSFVDRHNIHHHQIVLPSQLIDPGYLFILQNSQTTSSEVLMQSMGVSLVEFNVNFKNQKPQQEANHNIPVVESQVQLNETERNQYKAQLTQQIHQILKVNSLNTDLYLYYHSSQGYIRHLPVQKIFGLSYFSGVWKIIGIFFILFGLYVISVFVGLLVRFSYIFVITIVSLLLYSRTRTSIGWLTQYLIVARTASTPHKIKLLCYVGFAFIFTYLLFSFGQYDLASEIVAIFSPFLPTSEYWRMHLRNWFIIQLLFYLFCRSRTSLAIFPYLSMIFSIGCWSYCYAHPVSLCSFVLHYHLILHFLLFAMISFVEKLIIEDQFVSQYQPNLKKPRMLFYMGYDLDWHKSIPPIWTYFMKWYDWSFAGERQRVYLDGDYQLLYGRLLGMDEPQELPQQMEEEEVELNQLEMSESQ